MPQSILALAALVAATYASAQVDGPEQMPPKSTAALGPYTTGVTPIGVLLDDPAALAVLRRELPEVVQSGQLEMARTMTFKSVQAFVPEVLTDEKLAMLDAAFAKLPTK